MTCVPAEFVVQGLLNLDVQFQGLLGFCLRITIGLDSLSNGKHLLKSYEPFKERTILPKREDMWPPNV